MIESGNGRSLSHPLVIVLNISAGEMEHFAAEKSLNESLVERDLVTFSVSTVRLMNRIDYEYEFRHFH